MFQTKHENKFPMEGSAQKSSSETCTESHKPGKERLAGIGNNLHMPCQQLSLAQTKAHHAGNRQLR